jgi:hypothetical protein
LAQSLFGVPKKKSKSPMAQKRKASKKKPAAKGPQRKRPAKQKIQPVEEILFRVEGKMSTFGGPTDTGCRQPTGLRFLHRPICKTRNTHTYFFRRRSQA